MAKHAIVRTDNVFGTDNRTGVVSIEYMGANGTTPTEIDNGNVLKVGKLVDGERQIHIGSAPAAGDKIEDVVLIATPEIIYDSEKDYIGNFYNEAGVPARGYRIHSGSIFSVTANALDGTPAKDQGVEFGGTTKLKVAEHSASSIGSIIEVDTVGGETFYVIEIE